MSARAELVNARLADDGRSVIISGPGLVSFRSGFSAWVWDADNKPLYLYSSYGERTGDNAVTVERTAYGMASVQFATFHCKDQGIDLLFRLDKMANAPVVMMNAGIRNTGKQPVRLKHISPITMPLPDLPDSTSFVFRVEGKPSEWLLTGMHPRTPAVVALDEIQKVRSFYEDVGCYRPDGLGFLLGPVGTPVAFVDARFGEVSGGGIGLNVLEEMSNVRVMPGQTRWGQQVALFLEPPQQALVRWADWVGQSHGTRTAKGALTGWNSWFRGKSVTGQDVLAMADQVLKSEGRLRPTAIQIEDTFQAYPGLPLETNDRFPGGLASYAKRIAETGARPGLRLVAARYSRGDWTNFMAIARQAVGMGFTSLKIVDNLTARYQDAVAKGGGVLRDKTELEFVREGLREFRQALGDDVYIEAIGFRDRGAYPPSRVSLGFADACNTGDKIGSGTARAVIEQVLRSYHLNGRWFAVDNDCFYMATELKDVRPIDGGWPLARTWISMVGLSCGMAVTSDPWNEERFKPYWRNVEVLTPPARERTEVLDICTAREWPRLVGHVTRDWGDWTVALLWNPAQKEQTVTLDFAHVGMDPKRRYAVWSFWDNRFLGVAEGSWTTPFLAPSASQQLCFTELNRASDRPVLIGSGLHIYCGAAEIKSVAALKSAMQIELTDAGARAGDLFIYSRFEPTLRESTGCVVDGIHAAGENVWKLSLKDRRHGEAQRVELDIPLPVTRQAWFWGLIGIAASALVFGTWRYLAWLGIKQKVMLAEERSRISRDIHDELGSALTRITMQSEPPEPSAGMAAATTALSMIHRTSLEMARAMDEIVWAVNPRNDHVDRLAMYLDSYAMEFLSPSGIAFDVSLPDILPAIPVKAQARHNLFMAFREALNNVVRHSGAGQVRIRMEVAKGWFLVCVEDDGQGFEVKPDAAPRSQGGNGLGNMRDRLASVGGGATIASTPGHGTRVTLEVPLET